MKRAILFLAATFFLQSSIGLAAPISKVVNGKTVKLAYKLLVNGAVLESADAEHPFTYIHGQKQIVPGLEKNLTGLKVGDHKTIRVSPKEGYGMPDPRALREVEKDRLPAEVPKEKGTLVEARDARGASMLVKIVDVKEKTVVIDFNHPLAGKDLEFQVEVLGVS